MKISSISFLSIILISYSLQASTWGFKEENDVVILTEKNFDIFMEKYPTSMIEFYAPWCGHCKELKPKYEKAAKLLKEAVPSVPLAKVDADKHKNLGEKMNIEGFPTIFFFNKGVKKDFNGKRSAKGIFNWVQRRTKEATKPLNTVEELEEAKKGELSLVYFGKEDEKLNHFKNVAKDFADSKIKFYNALESTPVYETEPGLKVVFFRQFEPLRLEITGDFTVKSLTDFIEENRWPQVMPMVDTDEAVNRIYSSEDQIKTFAFSFFKKEGPYNQVFAKVAERNKNVVFMESNRKSDVGKEFFDYLSGDKKQEVSIRAMNGRASAFHKFKYEGDVTNEEELSQWISDIVAGKITRFLKSEPLPGEETGAVKTIVGINFEDMVQNSDKDILIMFYAPWCGHCKAFKKKYQELSENLAHMSDNLVIARSDATKNEYEGEEEIDGYPTFRFYKKGYHKKGKTGKEFSSSPSVKSLKKFLKKNVSFEWIEKEIPKPVPVPEGEETGQTDL